VRGSAETHGPAGERLARAGAAGAAPGGPGPVAARRPAPLAGWRPRVGAILAATVWAAGCGGGGVSLTIYSPHGRDLLTLVAKRFEALHPGVTVHWLDMGSQEVLDRLRSERANPQCDVWFGGPSPIFARGARDSLLAPADSAGRGPLYLSVYRTPAVIEYASGALTPAEAPHDWDDLLAPRWKGKVLIRDPLASGTMRAIFEMVMMRSLERTGDTTAGWAWLRRLDGQTREYVQNPALLHAMLERQEGLVSMWDLPDMLLLERDGRRLGYVFPTSGTPVIDDAIAVVRGARHPRLAREFVRWVRTRQMETVAARDAFRLPARTDIPADSLPAWVREVEAKMVVEPIAWDTVEAQGAKWMDYWDRNVRGTGDR
jgi:iron(III) transport system substrate-binding protein